jgi:hypothetical protein
MVCDYDPQSVQPLMSTFRACLVRTQPWSWDRWAAGVSEFKLMLKSEWDAKTL